MCSIHGQKFINVACLFLKGFFMVLKEKTIKPEMSICTLLNFSVNCQRSNFKNIYIYIVLAKFGTQKLSRMFDEVTTWEGFVIVW